MGSMSATLQSEIAQKYQGVASSRVIQAVQKASAKTGVDFAFLMEKASTESSFDPNAKSKSSSASGLYQFIDGTWLTMVKRYGDKYGLGDYADKIEMKNGKACVDDCDVKTAILNLRNNPEISACMAGEYSAENKDFLQDHTKGDVGATELYLAHFMGAGGAAKFLNARDYDGTAIGAQIFPNAAHANKNVFYDRTTGKPRTLDEIYNLFQKKFTGGHSADGLVAAKGSNAATATAHDATADTRTHLSHKALRSLPVFDDANESDDIMWADDPRFQHHSTGFFAGRGSIHRLSQMSILAMQEANETISAGLRPSGKDKHGYNS